MENALAALKNAQRPSAPKVNVNSETVIVKTEPCEIVIICKFLVGDKVIPN